MIQSIFGRKPEPEADPVPEKPAVVEIAADASPARPPRQMVDLDDIAPPADEVDPMDTAIADDGPSELRDRIYEAAKTVRDPEIPVNLLDLGLIYDLSVNREGFVSVEMTLTTPNCPSAAQLPAQMKEAIESVDGVVEAKVRVVFTPPWTPDMMSEEARLELGMM
jgi:FeS assembly SUF system protein